MQVARDRQGDEVTIRVTGDVDAHTSVVLEQELTPVVTDAGVRVVVDLSDMAFIDSSGLRVLIRAHRQATDAGTTFRLTGVNDTVRRLLEVTGLTELFELG